MRSPRAQSADRIIPVALAVFAAVATVATVAWAVTARAEDMGKAVERLRSPSPLVRRNAVLSLASAGPGGSANSEAAVDALLAAMAGDPDIDVRILAAEALGRVRTGRPAVDARTARRLADAVADRAADPDLRAAAMRSLLELPPAPDGDALPVPAATLTELLSDGDPAIRRMSAALLGRAVPEGAVLSALVGRMLDDPDRTVREAAGLAVLRAPTGTPQVAAAVRRLAARLRSASEEVREESAGMLAALGPDAAPAASALVKAVRAAAPERQADALAAALAAAAEDAGPETRAAALAALTEALHSADSDAVITRSVPLRRFGADGVAAAVPVLLTSSDHVADASYTAMVRMGPAAVPALTAALSDERPAVRMRAAWVLRRLGPPAASAGPALRPLLKDPDEFVREAAAAALGCVLRADAAEAVPVLAERLPMSTGVVRLRLAVALAEIPSAPAEAAEVALSAMLETLDEPPAIDAAELVADTLIRMGPRAASVLERLREKLDGDAAPVARLHAARALAAIDPDPARRAEAVAAISAMVCDGAAEGEVLATAAAVLAALDPSALPHAAASLAEQLGDAAFNHVEFASAAAALAELGPSARAALPALRRAMVDPSDRRREWAALAVCVSGTASDIRSAIAVLAEPTATVWEVWGDEPGQYVSGQLWSFMDWDGSKRPRRHVAAVRGLSAAGPFARPVLNRLRRSADPDIRRAAADALADLAAADRGKKP